MKKILQSKKKVDEALLKAYLDKLIQGNNRQQSSTDLMKHIVQDLLDYAQIKAGKFRKNLTSFNVKHAINEVIDI